MSQKNLPTNIVFKSIAMVHMTNDALVVFIFYVEENKCRNNIYINLIFLLWFKSQISALHYVT